MPEIIENHMVVDEYWDEVEYGVPNKRRLKVERAALEEAEYGVDDEFIRD